MATGLMVSLTVIVVLALVVALAYAIDASVPEEGNETPQSPQTGAR